MMRRVVMRDREHGGVLPLILGMLLVLAAAMFGATTIGRLVIAKGEAQRAADAACLTMANIVKHEGLQVLSEQQTRAEGLARVNTKLPLTFIWSLTETADAVDFDCKAIARVSAPMFIWQAGQLTATATAKGRSRQETITQAEKAYPQFVIVLDYSGSMQRNFQGQINSDPADDSIKDLIRAAKLLLDKDYDFRYGMVIFADGVVWSTPDVKLGNGAVMKDKVDDNLGCPYSPPSGGGCMTASATALSRAYDLITKPGLPSDENKYVLFVSDGEPTVPSSDPTGKAKAQAQRLWDAGVQIWTVHIINSTQSQTVLKQFMVSISGDKDHPGNAEQYQDASNQVALDDFFVGLGAGLACQLKLTHIPSNPGKLHVFVRDGQRDLPLRNARTVTDVPAGQDNVIPADQIGDLWDSREPFRDGDFFFYDESKQTLFVTPSICERVQNLDQNVVVRFASPQLTQ